MANKKEGSGGKPQKNIIKVTGEMWAVQYEEKHEGKGAYISRKSKPGTKKMSGNRGGEKDDHYS